MVAGCTLLDDGKDDGDYDVDVDPDYCKDVLEWNPDFVMFEDEVLRLTNERRAEGATCGGTMFGATRALKSQEALRCSARKHSKDMVEREFFAHDNPDGETPFDRMLMAGFNGLRFGENIAAGNATAEGTVAQWMDSPGHCANLMDPNFSELGVGYFAGGEFRHYWTQNFGAR